VIPILGNVHFNFIRYSVANLNGGQIMYENPLTPALSKLMMACQTLKTTEAKVLAAHLNKSPATVRTEFQRAMALMNVNCRYAALKTAEENGWLTVEQNQQLNS
jgi:hypothetical protein